jgi:ankyrin repeat protein
MLDPLERLRNAVIEGNLPVTKRLLIRFPDLWLNIDTNNQGWNNLHYASYYGNYLICSHLVSFMKKLNQNYSQLDLLTFDGLLVLHVCAIKCHHQVLHYLLQDFAQPWINLLGGEPKQSPLHYSCIHGFKQGVRLLLDFGADYKLRDVQGNSCFHLCFQYNNLDCLLVLLKFILLNVKDRNSALQEISELEMGQNVKGWCPFDYASTFKLIDKYKQLKKDIISSKLVSELDSHSNNNSLDETSIPSNESSILNISFNKSSNSLENINFNNKILSSPIISVTRQNRTHSQSLPPSLDTEHLIQPTMVRERSNTTILTKPPAIAAATAAFAGSNGINLPQTPSTKTPSLKSVTISPSTRLTNPTSPSSTISTSTSIESHEKSRRKGSFSNTNQWSFLHSHDLGSVQEGGSITRNDTPSPKPRRLSNVSSFSKLNLSRINSEKKIEDPPNLRKTRSSGTLLSIDIKPSITTIDNPSLTSLNSPDSTSKQNTINSISFTRVGRSEVR